MEYWFDLRNKLTWALLVIIRTFTRQYLLTIMPQVLSDVLVLAKDVIRQHLKILHEYLRFIFLKLDGIRNFESC